MKTWTIDRFEGSFAILEGVDGHFRKLPRTELPADAGEGDVLTEENGSYAIDPAQTKARKLRIEEKMNRLFRERGGTR